MSITVLNYMDHALVSRINEQAAKLSLIHIQMCIRDRVLLKEDGSTQLIRRAETPDDYFRTFDCFDILKDMKPVSYTHLLPHF